LGKLSLIYFTLFKSPKIFTMKKWFVACFALFLFNNLSAQTEFMHSLGGKYFFYGNSDGFSSAGILYSPRINLTNTGGGAISVGTHFGLGFSLHAGAGGSASSLVLDIPVVGEYNFGFGSTRESEAGFGGFIGAGYGIHRVSLNVEGVGGAATIHGPVFTGGIRFNIPALGPLELGGSYMLDLKSKEVKSNILGISLSYVLGMGGSE
jgi:hypothetical protein